MEFTDEFSRPTGDVLICGLVDGKPLADPTSIFKYEEDKLRVKVLDNGYIDVSSNLVVDNGRQVLANLLGGKGWNALVPNKDWIVTKISFGGYDEVPRFTDTSLSPQPTGDNEIDIGSGVFKKDLVSVDWPAPFIVRFEGLLESDEANGTTIREMGLWTENLNLVARKTLPAVSKSQDFALSIIWRIRL